MMKYLLFPILLLYCLPLYSQVITVNDFITLTSLSDKKFSSYVNKMGFVQIAQNFDNGTVINDFFYNNKKQPADSTLRFVAGSKMGKFTGVSYQTSSVSEYEAILKEFMLNGFIGGRQNTDSIVKKDSLKADDIKTDSNFFFQKEDMTVHVNEELRDEVKMFCFRLEKRPVPTKSSVRFADDLLVFDSHEKLVAMFGQGAVKRDMYYFSEMDSSRCSVLFPNSNRQAIFIWEDQANYRMLSFLMIGGGLRAESSSGFNQAVSLNTWRCYSGLYTGMRLPEILNISESDFNFYGYQSEFAMMAVPEKKGNMDFKKTGVTFGCLNCSNEPLVKREKISAEAALEAGLRLYVLSIVLIP